MAPDGVKRRCISTAFKWQIPFHEYLDARRNQQVLDEEDVIRSILA